MFDAAKIIDFCMFHVRGRGNEISCGVKIENFDSFSQPQTHCVCGIKPKVFKIYDFETKKTEFS